jgi:hypothetical protein
LAKTGSKLREKNNVGINNNKNTEIILEKINGLIVIINEYYI